MMFNQSVEHLKSSLGFDYFIKPPKCQVYTIL